MNAKKNATFQISASSVVLRFGRVGEIQDSDVSFFLLFLLLFSFWSQFSDLGLSLEFHSSIAQGINRRLKMVQTQRMESGKRRLEQQQQTETERQGREMREMKVIKETNYRHQET